MSNEDGGGTFPKLLYLLPKYTWPHIS